MRRFLYSFRLVAIFVAALTGVAAAAPDETLRVGLSTPPLPFDPATAATPEELAPVFAAYEHLVDPRGKAEVAASWRHSPDGLVWTFAIAPGHRFDNGRAVDATAVKFTLDRLMALGRAPASDALDHVARIDVPDRMTLRIVLKDATPRLLAILADRSASIVNPDVMKHAVRGDWGSGWLAVHSAGSGPYRLHSTVQGTFILERNPAYGGPPPWFSRLIFRVIADPTVRLLAAQKGEIDIGFLMPAQTLSGVAADGPVRIVSRPAIAFQNLAFNTEREVFKDIRLRRAIGAAIDVDGIVKYIRGGRASRFRGPLPAGMPGADPALYPVRFDPKEALRLAKAAGVKPGTPLSLIYPGVSPETDTVAQYIQAVLAPLGLAGRLERLSVPAYIDRMARGSYDIVLMGYVANDDDPASILNNWFDPAKAGVENPARYANRAIVPLLTAA
ncbi:MAG TPA: ABC transporter substrate-binding protein, partial [Rhizomicrobium sp.]